MYVEYLNDDYIDTDRKTKFHLDPDNLGPFQKDDLKHYMDTVNSFQIQIKLKHKLNKHVTSSSDCFEWTILQNYKYNERGVLVVDLFTDTNFCGSGKGIKIFRTLHGGIYLGKYNNSRFSCH